MKVIEDVMIVHNNNVGVIRASIKEYMRKGYVPEENIVVGHYGSEHSIQHALYQKMVKYGQVDQSTATGEVDI